jgi:hypothetical protein
MRLSATIRLAEPMAKSPRLARMLLGMLVFFVSTSCRCQYEVLLFRDGAVGDADVDADVVTSFTFSAASEMRTTSHGDTIGTMFDEDCPEGEALRGFSGSHQGDGFDLVTGLQGHCGRLVLEGDGTTITVEPSGSLDFHGEVSDVAAEWMCPANQVIVGIWGNAGTSQDGVGFYCAPLTLVGGTVTRGTVTTLPQAGGNGGIAYDELCAPGQLARGDYGSWVIYLHSFGLVCATPVVAQP